SSSRNPTSSPDVLGPEGDAMYLISSPAPDFLGRQGRLPRYGLQTPRGKARLPSRSPNKSAQTIHFDDIVLPPKSPMSVTNRQRSISPTKMQSEGNLSPWRIRVTVEAEQDEDENAQGSPRKKLKPSTMITKVPLKDEEWNPPSAKKRRGRPRKSDVQDQDATPNKGSPGRTPKRKPASPEKRPRGRPRKSVQSTMVAQSIETDEHPVTSPTSLDGAFETNSPVPSMEADHVSLADSQLELDPFLDIVGSGTLGTGQRATRSLYRFSPPSASENSHPESIKVTRVIEGTSDSTPLKTLAAARRVQATSPENTLHAGHTPRVRRSYPTPASSSLVDENQGSSRKQLHQEGDKARTTIVDPTDEHHEFDTIMESEGFSMVSLDTLPSAKQEGFNSTLNSAKGSLNPFIERHNLISYDKKSKSPVAFDKSTQSAASTSAKTTSGFQQSEERYSNVAGDRSVIQDQHEETRTYPNIARIVRIGLALHRTMRPQIGFGASDEELTNSRKRLERIFSDLNPNMQRQLQAGLKFGEQLARSHMRTERYINEEEKRTTRLGQGRRNSSIQEPARRYDSPRQEYPNMAQQEAQWQQEREEISRKIEMAASSDVIVLESDEEDVLQSEDQEQESLLDEADQEEGEADDTNYGDIWQVEARSHDWSSDRRSDFRASRAEDQASFQPEPPKRAQQGDLNTRYSTQYDWNPDSGELPPLGRSRMEQLRDEDVDISFLLKPRDTPKSRKYYGNGSPHTVASQKSHSSANGRIEVPKGVTVRDRLPSSRLGRPDDGDLDDIEPEEVARDEAPNKTTDEEEHEMGASYQETITPEHDSRIQDPIITPTRENTASNPSWFRRLTNNFTPGWWTKSEKEDFVEADKPLDESFSPPFHDNGNMPHSPSLEATPNLKRTREVESDPPWPVDAEDHRDQRDPQVKKPRLRALATSGYFTDAHYVALRRLYALAKRQPEQFPYHSNARRDEMIGDSLWTSDGEHGLPIAEIQFGIVDRFVSDLAEADMQNGGSGEVGWTEDDLHKRLFSIIVGEQIRREEKEQ
ncbi:hypothetical protein BGW36DRAFT_264073, partial [Talaromyces proteolyticus]